MSVIQRNAGLAVWSTLAALLLGGTTTFVDRAAGQTEAARIDSKADSDLAGVRAVVALRTEGQRKRDAVISAAPFSDDALWMNAFGRRVKGRAAIEQFFKELYADQNYLAGKNTEDSEPEIVFLRPDVAVAHTFHRKEGQRARDGSLMKERRIHQTMVLTRESKGWRIRNEVVMDEKESAPHR